MTDEIERAREGCRHSRDGGAEAGERAHRGHPSGPHVGRVPPIECDQPGGVRVVRLDAAGAESAGLEPVDETRQQHGARAVDPLERGQVEDDVASAVQIVLGPRHRPCDVRGVRELERPGRGQACVLAIDVHSDDHAHEVGVCHGEDAWRSLEHNSCPLPVWWIPEARCSRGGGSPESGGLPPS